MSVLISFTFSFYQRGKEGTEGLGNSPKGMVLVSVRAGLRLRQCKPRVRTLHHCWESGMTGHSITLLLDVETGTVILQSKLGVGTQIGF